MLLALSIKYSIVGEFSISEPRLSILKDRERSWYKKSHTSQQPVWTLLTLYIIMLLAPGLAGGFAGSFSEQSSSDSEGKAVSEHIPIRVYALHTILLREFDIAGSRSSTNYRLEEPFNHFVVGEMPTDSQLIYFAKLVDDKLLLKYAEMAPQMRRDDLYLWDPLGRSWHSEQSSAGENFYSNFIVHLIEDGSDATIVSILEFGQMDSVGRSLKWTAHTGPIPALMNNVKPVPETRSDREKLLHILTKFSKVSR